MSASEFRIGMGVFLACYCLYFVGATRVVPALDDHDLELQGTGFGLVSELVPLLLTDRDGIYYFAHPPLLHFYVGTAFLVYDDLALIKPYFDVSNRARNVAENRPIPAASGKTVILFDKLPENHGMDEAYFRPPAEFQIKSQIGDNYLIQKTDDLSEVEVPAPVAELGRIYQHFYNSPNLLEGRTVNLFFGAASVSLLVLWVGRISRRRWIALLVGLVFATNPEIFVRNSYGGYFAVSLFCCLGILMSLYYRWHAIWSAAVAAMAALANHKMVLLPFAYGLLLFVERIRTLRTSGNHFRHFLEIGWALKPTLIGFAAGSLIFWLYGLVVDADAFYQDHIRQHLVNRIANINYLGYWGYPSRLELWKEMLSHTGYVLIPGAVITFTMDCLNTPRSSNQSVDVRNRYLWMVYSISLAVAFTVVDWRMTKHLMPMLLPVFLLIAPHRKSSQPRLLFAVFVLCIAGVANVPPLFQLASDFYSFKISPAW